MVARASATPRRTADRILAIINHIEDTVLILQSDLRPDLNDKVPTLNDTILRELIVLDSKKLKIPISDAEVDRHLARVQEQLKMTRDDLMAFFKQKGLTLEQAKAELKKTLLIETTIDHRVKSKSYVSNGDIEKYNNEHPLIFYEIKQAQVPFTFGSKVIQRAVIDRAIESGEILTSVQWLGPFTLKDEDFSQDKNYIKELAPGTVVKVQETDEALSLIQLVEKRVVPLAVRKRDITNLLGRERYMKALDDYYDGLLKDAHISYLVQPEENATPAP